MNVSSKNAVFLSIDLYLFMCTFIAKGDNIALRTLTKHRDFLKPAGVLKEVKLIEDWIATKSPNGNYTWTLRSNAEIKKEHVKYAIRICFPSQIK